jgi:hypothetical protein
MKRKETLICITRNETKQNKSEQKEGQRVAYYSNSICMNSSYLGCERDLDQVVYLVSGFFSVPASSFEFEKGLRSASSIRLRLV